MFGASFQGRSFIWFYSEIENVFFVKNVLMQTFTPPGGVGVKGLIKKSLFIESGLEHQMI